MKEYQYKFKKGDSVVCITLYNTSEIVLNKVYTVRECYNNDFYSTVSLEGIGGGVSFFSDNFIPLYVDRINKILKLKQRCIKQIIE